MPFLAVMILGVLSFILLLWHIIIDFWMLSHISIPRIRILVDSRTNPLGHGANASLWVSGQSASIFEVCSMAFRRDAEGLFSHVAFTWFLFQSDHWSCGMSWQSCPDAMFKYSRLSAQFRAIKYIVVAMLPTSLSFSRTFW